jgi:hypothetical protein
MIIITKLKAGCQAGQSRCREKTFKKWASDPESIIMK